VKALLSFGVTGFEELLELARPGLDEYAHRHGYTLLTDPPARLERPPSWHKVTVMLAALEVFDEVLWVDCDTVIVDATVDLADEVPAGAWQAITRHQTPEGEVPSAGVWYVRQPMQPVLHGIWRMTEYLHHRWWEQAALQSLLGYTPDLYPVRLIEPTDLYRRTHWLDPDEWNALQPQPQSRIVHAAPGNTIGRRADVMRDLTNLALKGA
jgi:hypothetical protein